MPRPLPSYRLHKPSGRAVVTLDGKDHYFGGLGSAESRENCHRLLAEWMVARRAQEPAATTPTPTVAEMILAFRTHARAHYRHPDGRPTREIDNLKAALRQLYGLTPARDFGPLALRAVREEMVRSGLTRTGINGRVNRIRRAFKWAASGELVPTSVAEALRSVDGLQAGRTGAKESGPVGPVTLDVVEATLPHLARPVSALVRLQLLTGMRPGEACARRGVDLQAGEPDWTYRPPSHKTAWRGKGREIVLGPRAVELVRGFLGPDPEAYLFRPADAVAELTRPGPARGSRGRRPRSGRGVPSGRAPGTPSDTTARGTSRRSAGPATGRFLTRRSAACGPRSSRPSSGRSCWCGGRRTASGRTSSGTRRRRRSGRGAGSKPPRSCSGTRRRT